MRPEDGYPVSLSTDVQELRRENATLRARLREREEECQRWALRWATDGLARLADSDCAPFRNELCSVCGRWHDHTGDAIVAMRDWQGREWEVKRGTMPTPNGDDLGGRVYTSCPCNASRNAARV